MKKSKVQILSTYENQFREVLLDKIKKDPKPGESYSSYVRRSLKLSAEQDWTFLCSAMDLVGDTCLSIEHFLRFGISGPTRYDDTGEKYLRLYGILNTTYLQQQSVLKIYKILNGPDYPSAIARMASLVVREARNKLGSHSIDYLNGHSEEIESFVPVRITMGDFDCEYCNGNDMSMHRVDLRQAIEVHLDLMIELYDQIFEKTVNTLYKTAADKRNSVLEGLKDLRIEKAGGIIVAAPNGEKIVISFAGSI